MTQEEEQKKRIAKATSEICSLLERMNRTDGLSALEAQASLLECRNYFDAYLTKTINKLERKARKMTLLGRSR